MTPQKLSDLINSNQIDLRKLDNDRLQILDGLQKKGVIQNGKILNYCVVKDHMRIRI